MPRYTDMGELLSRDAGVLAALAERSHAGWGGIRASVSLRDLALAAGVGESKVAITMKYAVKNGYAARSNHRIYQAAWLATDKLDAEIGRLKAEQEPPPPRVEPQGQG